MHHGHVLIYIGNQYSKYPFGTQCSRVLLTMPRSIKIRKKRETNVTDQQHSLLHYDY